jgi:hypothetical protein
MLLQPELFVQQAKLLKQAIPKYPQDARSSRHHRNCGISRHHWQGWFDPNARVG